MENHLYIVSWGGESKVMAAPSKDALWNRIKRRYLKGCKVTIEDSESKKIYVR